MYMYSLRIKWDSKQKKTLQEYTDSVYILKDRGISDSLITLQHLT
jgi:hypothetical protein